VPSNIHNYDAVTFSSCVIYANYQDRILTQFDASVKVVTTVTFTFSVFKHRIHYGFVHNDISCMQLQDTLSKFMERINESNFIRNFLCTII
jgi:hypothetical protein